MPIIHSPINQDQKQHEQLGVAFAEQANTQVAALLFIKQQDTGGHGNAERQPHGKNDGEKLTYVSLRRQPEDKQANRRQSERSSDVGDPGHCIRFLQQEGNQCQEAGCYRQFDKSDLIERQFPRLWVCCVLARRCFRCLLRRHTVACRKLRATFGVRFFGHSRVSQTGIKTRVGTMVAISKTVASEPVDALPRRNLRLILPHPIFYHNLWM